MTPISCGDISSEMYLDIEVYLSEYLQSSQVYHGVYLYGTTAGYGANADTNISICNRWERNPGLDVTDRDKPFSPRLKSQSVTRRGLKPFYLLQNKTKENVQSQYLNL